MVHAVGVAAAILAGENLVLNILSVIALHQPLPSWTFSLVVFVFHRVTQTVLAVTVIIVIMLLRDWDQGIAIPRLCIMLEGAVELTYLYHIIQGGLHSSRLILRHERVILGSWIVLKVLPWILLAFLPWRFQSVPFAMMSLFDQVMQMVLCGILCQRVAKTRGHLLKTNQLCRSHFLWGLSRSAFQVIISITSMTASVVWPRHQFLWSLVQIGTVLIYPTPRAFLRFTRWRRGKPNKRINGYRFCFDPIQAQHFYPIEGRDEQSSLEALRQHLPWSTTYPRHQSSAEEFLLLSPSLPPEHPYLRGKTPALCDVFRAICHDELQTTISNFSAHRKCCGLCSKGDCPRLLRLICMLLLDRVGSRATLRLDDQDLISASGTTLSSFHLTAVEAAEPSGLLLKFVIPSNVRSIIIPWENLWQLNLLGIDLSVSTDITDILPGWSAKDH